MNKIEAKENYKKFLKEKLNLDLTRGQPSKEQLKLSEPLDQILKNKFIFDGEDIRNYGLIKGLNSARKLGGILLGVNYKNVIANGTSSLNLTFMALQALLFTGLNGSPWINNKKISSYIIDRVISNLNERKQKKKELDLRKKTKTKKYK